MHQDVFFLFLCGHVWKRIKELNESPSRIQDSQWDWWMCVDWAPASAALAWLWASSFFTARSCWRNTQFLSIEGEIPVRRRRRRRLGSNIKCRTGAMCFYCNARKDNTCALRGPVTSHRQPDSRLRFPTLGCMHGRTRKRTLLTHCACNIIFC